MGLTSPPTLPLGACKPENPRPDPQLSGVLTPLVAWDKSTCTAKACAKEQGDSHRETSFPAGARLQIETAADR